MTTTTTPKKKKPAEPIFKSRKKLCAMLSKPAELKLAAAYEAKRKADAAFTKAVQAAKR